MDRLRGSPGLKNAIERSLARRAGIEKVLASELTGTVLVQFEPARDPEGIIAAVRDLVETCDRSDGAAAEAAEESDWHCLNEQDLGRRLRTSGETGLSSETAKQRLQEVGRNAFAAVEPRSSLSILAGQFQSAPVALLAGAAIVSFVTGAALEAGAVLAVLALNGGIGCITESRAERTIRSLESNAGQMARVRRDGEEQEVAAEALVPGDVLELREGDLVAADSRLIAVDGLTVNESALTGESEAVAKQAEPLPRRGLPRRERSNMVFRGTAVTRGHGRAVVVATGRATEMGRIQHLVGTVRAPMTPMQQRLESFGRLLAWMGLGLAGLITAIGVLRGRPFFVVMRSALSLAVAAVPEALPALAASTLAFGIEDMRRRKVLVRRLDAIETLSSVRIVCFDKTGTLTLNRMSVEMLACGDDLLHASDVRLDEETAAQWRSPGPVRLLQIGALCSDAEVSEEEPGQKRLNGSSTESALVRAALGRGIDVGALRARYPRSAVERRTESHHLMTTVHALDRDRVLVAVKGSPLEVLERCTFEDTSSGPRKLSPERRGAIEKCNQEMARRALRVLGFAYREAGTDFIPDNGAVGDLTWVGLVGLADEIRPGIAPLMMVLRQAGLHAIIVTGDQPETAAAIARRLGLGEGPALEIIDAEELDRLSPSETAAAAKRAHVFSRVSPAEKLTIIRALQQSGTVVAMVGDGINDSPALRAADIGIALGKEGTSAAREVADIVLESDDIGALLAAIERGRTTTSNIRRAIHYLIATNLSECIVMLAGATAGLAEPLSPIQLLWINLISDVLPGLGLALEPAHRDIMDAPADADILGATELKRLGGYGAALAAGPLAAAAFGALRHGGAAPATRTMTFASLVMAQLLHALTARSAAHTIFDRDRLPPNRLLLQLIAGSLGIQAVTLLLPGARRLLGLAPLGPLDMAITLAGGVLPWLANEAVKAARGREHGRNAAGMPVV